MWHPKTGGIDGRAHGKSDCRQMPHTSVNQGPHCGNRMRRTLIFIFRLDLPGDPIFFILCEEFSFRWTAWQQEVRQHTADYGRNTLQNEQPSSASQSEPVHVVQNHARKRLREYWPQVFQ
jgi:hypothetical protein